MFYDQVPGGAVRPEKSGTSSLLCPEKQWETLPFGVDSLTKSSA
jgi:hypothetical protein